MNQGKQLIWSTQKYAIYNNQLTKLHEFYEDGLFNKAFSTFDKAYKHSMKVRGLKYWKRY